MRRSWVWAPATTGPSALILSAWVYLGAPVFAAIRTEQVRPTVATCRKRQLLSTNSPSRLQQHFTYIHPTICSNAHVYGHRWHNASFITTISFSSYILWFRCTVFIYSECRVHQKFFRPIFFPHLLMFKHIFEAMLHHATVLIFIFLVPPNVMLRNESVKFISVSSAQKLWLVRVWVSFGAFCKLKVGLHECEERRPSGHHQ